MTLVQVVTLMQIAASWLAIVAQNFIPWPMSFIVGMVLLMALIPAIIDQAARIRAMRKQRRTA